MALRIAFVVGGASDDRFVFEHRVTGGKYASRYCLRPLPSIKQSRRAQLRALRAFRWLHHP